MNGNVKKTISVGQKISKMLCVYTCAEGWLSRNVGMAGGRGHTGRVCMYRGALSEVPEEEAAVCRP